VHTKLQDFISSSISQSSEKLFFDIIELALRTRSEGEGVDYINNITDKNNISNHDLLTEILKKIKHIEGIVESDVEKLKDSQCIADARIPDLEDKINSISVTVESISKKLSGISNASINHDFLKIFDNHLSIEPKTGIELVFVPGGSYHFGMLKNPLSMVSQVKQEIHVDDFWLAKFLVTQNQWSQFMANKSFHRGGDHPLENRSWNDIGLFLDMLQKKTKLEFRLPTEFEWEFACRSGGKIEEYAGGMPLDDVGWYAGNSDGRPHPVGQKNPNVLGLYDMCGNVGEWTATACDNNEYVIRGGNYDSTSFECRSIYRSCAAATRASMKIGFRVAVTKIY
jgi:hypothetical protein